MRTLSPSTATRRIHDDIGDAKPAFDRAGLDRHVLNILKSNRRFMNHPDTAANAKAALAQNIPGRVVTKAHREIRDLARDDGESQCQWSEPQTNYRKGRCDCRPRDQDQRVEDQECEPELKLQVTQE